MITINLLPKERRKVASNLLFNLGVLGVSLALIVLSVGGAFAVHLAVLGLNSQLRHVDRELDDRAEVLDLVAQLEEYKKILDQKEEVIDTLVRGRIKWGRKLWELAQLVPPKVWLERMQLETKIVKEKIRPPETTTGSSRRQATAPQFREIRTDYLHIYAVTHDLEKKSSIIGDFIDQIRSNESFFEDFETVDFKEGEEQLWIVRDEDSPPVWRFRLTLRAKSKGPRDSSGGVSQSETI